MEDKSQLTSVHLIYKINTWASARALLLAGFWLWSVAGSSGLCFFNVLGKHWFMHLFIQQTFVKWFWNCSSEQNQWKFFSHGACVLLGWQARTASLRGPCVLAALSRTKIKSFGWDKNTKVSFLIFVVKRSLGINLTLLVVVGRECEVFVG